YCFFFQAEDGIRDWSVTGVQTCALPICTTRNPGNFRGFRGKLCIVLLRYNAISRDDPPRGNKWHRNLDGGLLVRFSVPQARPHRSEERRVGKECRAGGGGEA